jgi:hypothetical protein
VERSEAEAIYAQGREAVVDVVLALSARLEAQDAQQGRWRSGSRSSSSG